MLQLCIVYFIINIIFCVLFGLIDHGKIIEIEFILGFSSIMTLIFITIDKLAIIPEKKPDVIIVKPPQWVYTYNALNEHLPDCLIREVMKYQFYGNPYNLDFSIYEKFK